MFVATASVSSNPMFVSPASRWSRARHVNLPGWFSWLIFCRFLRQEPTSPTTVKIFDKWIVPAVRWFETRVRVPFGQSVFLVARKPG